MDQHFKPSTIEKSSTNSLPETDGLFAVYSSEDILPGKRSYLLVFNVSDYENIEKFQVNFCKASNVLVICFSVIDPISFDNVWHRWFPEVLSLRSRAPIVLVGTEIDARDDPKIISSLKEHHECPISNELGWAMALKIGALRYMECSTFTPESLNEVFEQIKPRSLETPRHLKKRRRIRCSLL